MTTSPLIRILTICAALPMVAGAQVPAPRPVPAVAPTPAVPALAPTMPTPLVPLVDLELAMPVLHSMDIDLVMPSIELELADARLAGETARLAMARVDLARLAEVSITIQDRLLESRPRAAWASEDPADSLYRIAREALNRGEYRRAAQMFNEVTKKYPTSKYAIDCAYWEAFARYRLGTTEELKYALQILDGKGAVPISAADPARAGRPKSNTAIDIPALRARVQGALAARGDREAAAALQAEARESTGCDREEVSVRAEALQALAQMDRPAAMPSVKKVLLRRDECTVELRRRALYLLSREPDAEASTLALDVAKNDPDEGIRSEAMRVVARIGGDNAITSLEEILRTATDERSQRGAVYALSSIDSDRARRAVRAIIERNDANERVRQEAILSLARDRERAISAEEVTYLRTLYTRLESARLREAVLTALSRAEGAASAPFLLGIARNEKEPTSLRATAIQRVGMIESVNLNDIAKLYDVADARSLREQILIALSRRKEPEAIDKLMEIAKRDTDPEIRRTAINLLGRSNNERAKQLLKELIEK